VLVLDAEELVRKREALPPFAEFFCGDGLRLPEFVVLNKIDLVQKQLLLPLLDRLHAEFSRAAGSPVEVIPISARTGDGLAVLEERVAERLPFGPKYFPDEYVTDQTEQVLAQEVIREKLFYLLGQEVPYSTAVLVEKWEEADELLTIRATIFVERVSQRGILIGRGGERLREIGSRARADLEKIFGMHIFLDLFVRVEEEWTATEHGLQRIGMLR
jgi:GTP-binding protein Era